MPLSAVLFSFTGRLNRARLWLANVVLIGFGRLAAAAVILLAAALPGAADGVSQFEQKIRPLLPPSSFTYANAKALGDNGFVLEDVVVTPPADATGGVKAVPIAIKRVTVEDFDFAGLDKQMPLFLKIRVEGITVAGTPATGVDLNELAGVDKAVADFTLDYRVDPDSKTLTLEKLELDVGGLARFELSLALDGVSPDLAGQLDAAMNRATLRTATLIFEDRSLLSKVVPAAAKFQGTDVDAIIKQAKIMIDGMRAGQSEATIAVFDALSSYLDDYKHPKGPLKITVNPPNKASAAALRGVKSLDDVVNGLGLVISYGAWSGSRSDASSRMPAAPNEPQGQPRPPASPNEAQHQPQPPAEPDRGHADLGQARFVNINISGIANGQLDWLQRPPRGHVKFDGIPFTILSGDRSVIHMHNRVRSDYPSTLRFPIGEAPVASVHLLLCGDWISNPGQHVGTVRISYSDGSSRDVPLISLEDIRETWMANSSLPGHPFSDPPEGVTWNVAYSESQMRGGMASTAFLDRLSIRTDPARRINEVSFLTNEAQTGMILIAMTLEITSATVPSGAASAPAKPDQGNGATPPPAGRSPDIVWGGARAAGRR